MNFSRRLDEALGVQHKSDAEIFAALKTAKRLSGRATLYKGMNEHSFGDFKQTKIPGFIGEFPIAMVYAEPELADDTDAKMYIISSDIDLSEVVDLNHVLGDVSGGGWPVELRDEVWAANGSAHGEYFTIFYGRPISNYKLVMTFDGEGDWKQAVARFGWGGNKWPPPGSFWEPS